MTTQPVTPDAEAETTWTPELRADLQRHTQEWFNAHPGLKAGLSHKMQDFWSSSEGDKLRAQMSAAATGTGVAQTEPPAPAKKK